MLGYDVFREPQEHKMIKKWGTDRIGHRYLVFSFAERVHTATIQGSHLTLEESAHSLYEKWWPNIELLVQ